MAFTGEYVKTTELGTLSDGRIVELGHYKDGDSEYGEKIYIRGTYKTRAGVEKESITATKLTLKDLAELQQIDLSGFDLETDVDFD